MLGNLGIPFATILALVGILPFALARAPLDPDTPTKDEYAEVDKRFHDCCVAGHVTAKLLPWCTFAYLDAEKPRERIPFSDTDIAAVNFNACLFIKAPKGSTVDDVRDCCTQRGIPAVSPCQSALCTRDYYVTLMEGRGGLGKNRIGRDEAECETFGPTSASQERGDGADKSAPPPLPASSYPPLSEKTRKMRLIAFSCWRDLHVAVLRSGQALTPATKGQETARTGVDWQPPMVYKGAENDAGAGVEKADGVSAPPTTDKEVPIGDNTEAATVATGPDDGKPEGEQIPTLGNEGQTAPVNIGNDGHDGTVGVWQEAQQVVETEQVEEKEVTIKQGPEGAVKESREAKQVVETEQAEEKEVKVEQGPDGAVQESREVEQVVETQQVDEEDEIQVAEQASPTEGGDKAVVD